MQENDKLSMVALRKRRISRNSFDLVALKMRGSMLAARICEHGFMKMNGKETWMCRARRDIYIAGCRDEIGME